MAKYLDQAGARELVRKILELLEDKVSVENGKSLSTEDFTSALKTKLEGLENYILPTATSNILGGVKIGSGLMIENGTLSTDGTPASAETMTTEEVDALFETS